ncbi:hypothetical protein P4C99_05395 [Pontiellaceae bacterium B1224]|nr:hypothetical protein [Pontiellaceae bacterium B1224]
MHKLIKQGNVLLALLFIFMFILGFIWSIVPIFGNTLPQHLEVSAGIPFHWAALLISFSLGVLIVAAMALIGLVQTSETTPNG